MSGLSALSVSELLEFVAGDLADLKRLRKEREEAEEEQRQIIRERVTRTVGELMESQSKISILDAGIEGREKSIEERFSLAVQMAMPVHHAGAERT